MSEVGRHRERRTRIPRRKEGRQEVTIAVKGGLAMIGLATAMVGAEWIQTKIADLQQALAASSQTSEQSTSESYVEFIRAPKNREGLPNLSYPVQPGDTLWDIADWLATTPQHLAFVNGIEDINKIYVGQEIRMAAPLNDSPILIIHSVGFVPSPETPSQFIVSGFDYQKQRLADRFWQGTYYYAGELDSAPKHQEGLAHFYGLNPEKEYLNPNTSSGERFDPNQLICASWFYPIQSVVRVTFDGRSVDCRVIDRGPDRLFEYDESGTTKNVIIDLSVGAARQVGLDKAGEGHVSVELISLPEGWTDIANTLPNG